MKKNKKTTGILAAILIVLVVIVAAIIIVFSVRGKKSTERPRKPLTQQASIMWRSR